jgi:hypothetical protein
MVSFALFSAAKHSSSSRPFDPGNRKGLSRKYRSRITGRIRSARSDCQLLLSQLRSNASETPCSTMCRPSLILSRMNPCMRRNVTAVLAEQLACLRSTFRYGLACNR